MLNDIFRVSFIGHREVENFVHIEEELENIVRILIETKEYVEFYIGRNGEFDVLAAPAIKRAQKDYGKENSLLILVIPYYAAHIKDYEKYYDEVLYPEELYNVHYKSAIKKRNEWFVNNTDMLVAFVERNYGGAYKCFRQAKEKGLRIINLYKQ